ncbi:MAG TPA: hypothetical protein VK171_00605 [Fimbriimonas sp.]|nr:hypothetical protein [Fimbriimonas sp.]
MKDETRASFDGQEMNLPFEGHLWLEANKDRENNEPTLTMDSPPTENELRVAEIEKISTMEHTIRMLALNGLRRIGPEIILQDYDQKEIIENIHTKLIEQRQTLGYEESSMLEKMVIEQIMTLWVQWYVAGWQVEAMPYGDAYMKQNHYLERRFLRCQSRLMRGYDQLARMRAVPREYLIGGRPLKATKGRNTRR